MREIKFRQRLVDDTWHYWGFIDGHFVAPVLNQETYEDAIKHSQQYTGLKDKNEKEIYEGDIVKFTEGYIPNGETRQGVVTFKDCCFHINDDYELLRDTSAGHLDCEIIGNIHSNPELIEKVEEIPQFKGTNEALDKLTITNK